MSDFLELDRITERAKEPAKAWRNRWRTTAPRGFAPHCSCGATHFSSAGKREVWGCMIWPSRELAENSAAEDLAANYDPHISYLGAFPVSAA